MKKIKLITLLCSICLIVAMVACAAPTPPPPEEEGPPPEEVAPAKPIVWKYACFGSPNSVVALASQWVFGEIEERSEGRLKIESYWNQSLCPAKEQAKALKSGLCQVTNIVPGYVPAGFALYNMGNLPMLFPLRDDDPSCWRIFYNAMQEWASSPAIKEEFAEWNALYLAESEPGTFTLTGNFRPTNLEDLKGKKIRAVGGIGVLLDRVGAVPTIIISPEMYDALSKGTLDAIVQNWVLLDALRIYDVSTYYAPRFALGNVAYSLAISKRDYEALPEDIKEIIQELRSEYVDRAIEIRASAKEEVMDRWKEAGMEFVEFSEEDYEKLAEISKLIWEEEVQKLEGQGLPAKEAFNALQDAIKKYVPEHELYYIK